ncbi:MAG TPA: RHS repeat-associated core domain-containing protein [Pyrinomonadaceae bacterium]|nr:RHS repeat-associated core domain-containing protein [Pyrinomonadaceae bacterium]
MKELAARLAAVVCALLALSAAPSAQNIQFTQGSVSAGLDNTFRIPVASHPGRGAAGLPVTLNYSSRVWRVGHLSTIVNNFNFQTIAEAIYAEHSASGWKTTLDLPTVEWPKEDDLYYASGRPFCNACQSASRRFRVARVFIHMPDGATHELRQSDQPYEGAMIKTGDFFAVDGSRLRYDATSGTLYLTDGSRYVLGAVKPQFIDRNGNALTYDPAARKWTDTMNRELAMPWPAKPLAQEYTYAPPGFDPDRPYRFIWKRLSEPGVLTPVEGSQPPQPPARLPIANDYLPNPSAPPTNSGGGNYPQSLGPVGQVRPSLFVTDQAGFDDTPTIVVGRGQSGGELFDPVVLAEVVLPNGLSYKFSYNVYGEIDRVVYPTGGSEQYRYTELAPASSIKLPYSQASRAVSQRQQKLTSVGATVSTWTYEASNALGALIKTTAPDGSYTEVRKHGGATPPNGWPFGFEPAKRGQVADERVYDKQGGLMLRRSLTDYGWTEFKVPPRAGGVLTGDVEITAYRNARPTKSVSLILDTGGDALAKTVIYRYDDPTLDANTTRHLELTTGLDRTGMEETGFAGVDPNTAKTGDITSIPAGPVVSETRTTYQRDAGYRSRNILGLVTSVTLMDGASRPVSKTESFYDESNYAVLPPYGDLGEDAAYADPETTLRANPTTVRRYVDLTLGTYLETHAQFDQYGNPVNFWDERGVQSQKEYSAAHRHAYLTRTVTAAPDPSGEYGSAQPFTSDTTYDGIRGLVLTTTDANGQVTEFKYQDDAGKQDALNRLRRVNRPDGGWTKTEYNDVVGNLFVHVESKLDAARSTHSYQFFDQLGRSSRSLAHETGMTYVAADTRYDLMGRAHQTSNPFRVTVTGAGNASQADYWAASPQAAHWTTSEYDTLGRVKTVTLPDSTFVTTDYKGVYTTVTDQALKSRRQKTDALGRIVRVDEPDASGQLGDLGSPLQPSFYEYDTLGNVVRINQGLAQAGADPENSLSYIQHRYFKYDALSRLTHERQVEQDGAIPTGEADPLTGNANWSRRLVYDETLDGVKYKGLLTTAEDARRVVTTFRYDRLGRAYLVTYSDGTPSVKSRYDQPRTDTPPAGEPAVTFHNKGRLTEVTTDADPTTPQTRQLYDYDLAGRTRRQRQAVGADAYELRYAYNLGGGLVSERYPSGRVVNYAYDDAGRLLSAGSGATSYASAMAYKPFGGLESMALGNGAVYSMAYSESRLQLSGITLTHGASVIQKYEYKYGRVDAATGGVDETKNNGQIARIESTIGAQRQWQQRFSYDSLGRLSSAGEYRGDDLGQSYLLNYDYDQFGNRYQKSERNQNNPVDQYWAEDGAYSPATNRLLSGLTYDPSGNVTIDGRFRMRAYLYDANNRQRQSSATNGSGAVRSVYDGAGQRVATQVGDAVTAVFVYDAFGQLAAEYAPSAAQGGTQYVASDHQGTPRVVMNSAGGGVASRRDYLPFGEDVPSSVGMRAQTPGYSEADGVRRKYAGMERDDSTGMSHTLWREYDSLSARWTAPDPYGGSMEPASPQSFNRYSYVNNDPVNKVDPTGLMLSDIGVHQTANPAVEARLNRASAAYTARYNEGARARAQERQSGTERANAAFTSGMAEGASSTFLNNLSGGGSTTTNTSGSQEQAAALTPCDVRVPSDPDDRAVVGTILGEATPYPLLGNRQYDASQAGVYKNGALPAPTGEVITETTLRQEAVIMASVVDNRFTRGDATVTDKDGTQRSSWTLVVSQPGQFLGYSSGMAQLNRGDFGNNGSPACEKLRFAVDAVAAVNARKNLYPGVYNWRGVLQPAEGRPGHTRIRAQGNAIRVGGTDFW